jgi:hypothetical protein
MNRYSRKAGNCTRAHREFPCALRCDPWWAIRGAGEPLEPIFAELMYGLEPRSKEMSRKSQCLLDWGPAIGIYSRRTSRGRRTSR